MSVPGTAPHGRLLAISDLHVGYARNRETVLGLRPGHADDWLIVAGDVGEKMADVRWALTLLAERFATVIWVPGNHELWTPADDPVQLRGEERYRELVRMCRELGVVTPEDDFPVWRGAGGPVVVVPLFVLYDYTFRPPGTTKEQARHWAESAGIVCTDEFLLHADPYQGADDWCQARLRESERRLAACDPALPTVLVNHFPLTREPTWVLRYPQFAQWCGTTGTATWHLEHRAAVVVYGHLHIPRTTLEDGVRFEEVSLGYPREQDLYGRHGDPLRVILSAGEPT